MTNPLPYTPSQSSLTRFLKHIQVSGVPSKVDRTYLKSVGFKSGNDGYIPPILKVIGFLDSRGVPATRWRSYKDTARAPRVLGAGVSEAYAELFVVYPDAYRKDDEAIRNWIRPKTGFDEVKVGHAVATFKTLCGLAEFEPEAPPSSADPTPPPDTTVPLVRTTPTLLPAQPQGPSININIELQLPPSADGVSYDKFFESMKKHLFPDGQPPS